MTKSIVFRLSAWMFVLLLSAAPALADVKTPSLFGDNMVLQRGQAVPVWGTAEKGEKVTVTFGDQEKSATAGDDGKWQVKLDALEASAEPRELTVSGNNKLTFNNVVVGEVWICSGQSNMEWTVNGALQPDVERKAADYPMIRHIKVPHTPSDKPLDNFNGKWDLCSEQTVGNFTAVGYYFGRELHNELEVPVGLINSSWGGTRIEPWTPLIGFEQIKDDADFAAGIIEKIVNNKLGGGHQEPTKLYRGMIHPLVPYAFKGAIWYQGESNGGEGISYYYKKHALVDGWRTAWDQGDFPFYWVQLANFTNDRRTPEGGDGYARVRDAERKALDIENTGMAVIIDIGETRDIHPKNKQDVGKRLAQWALAKDYGRDVVPSGPLFTKHAVEGKTIRCYFDHVGDGLMIGKKEGLEPVVKVQDGKLERFAIANEDRQWVWADAKIEGDTIVVSSPDVSKPVAVRYAYSANPLGANLYNEAGLPASPFRTDDW